MFKWLKNLFKIDIPDVSAHIAEEPKIANFKTGAIKHVSVTSPGTGYNSTTSPVVTSQATPQPNWVTTTTTSSNYTIGSTASNSGIFTVGAGGGGGYISGGGGGGAGYAGYSHVNPPSGWPNNYTFHTTPTNIISIAGGPNNKELVRLNSDGTVTWTNGVEDLDEAAKTFSRMLSLSAEMAAGITTSVKLRMRDSVFEDLISFAKE